VQEKKFETNGHKHIRHSVYYALKNSMAKGKISLVSG